MEEAAPPPPEPTPDDAAAAAAVAAAAVAAATVVAPVEAIPSGDKSRGRKRNRVQVRLPLGPYVLLLTDL